MKLLADCLLLMGIPVTLIVAGYWLAFRLGHTTPAERLATATLAGLCLLIWNVSVLGFFRPITGAWTWICLWPLALTLIGPRARGGCWRDFSTVAFNRRGAIAALSTGLFLIILLWPLLRQPGLIFYDGTSNHDAFFWISGAEFLHEHTYLVEPVKSALQPLTNGVGVFTGGWTPLWGRMSSEGLLALLSAIVGVPPLQCYVVATAALFIPWVAAVYLVARTFLIGRPGSLTLVALCGAQPLFVFFQSNANLPNLLGALAGAVVIVAIERGLRANPDRFNWMLVLALGLHGLLCSYPEMAPFVLLPAGLLIWRGGFSANPKSGGKFNWAPVFAGLAGLALNPATSVRAFSGFFRAMHAARTDEIWPKLFQPLAPADYPAALATMTLHTSDDLGVIVAACCSGLILVLLAGVVWRARDRTGTLAILSGAGLLLSYTIATHFNYGWQKTAQFGAIFCAAILPVSAIEQLSHACSLRPRRISARVALMGLGLFFLYATGRNCFESHKWAQRKAITQDWLAIRNYSHDHLRNTPVLVDAPSFPTPYFHGMWAIYFLADSFPIFSERGQDNGGYLHDYTRNESQSPAEPAPAAILVSAKWADSFDANSPRLVSGDSVVLLEKVNRVDTIQGFIPKAGVPESAAAHLVISLRPHRASQFTLELTPAAGTASSAIHWRITCRNDQAQSFAAEVDGPPPWRFAVPLAANQKNRIEINTTDAPAVPAFPFTVTHLQIQNAP